MTKAGKPKADKPAPQAEVGGDEWDHPNYGRATEPPWVTIPAGEAYHDANAGPVPPIPPPTDEAGPPVAPAP